MCTGQSPNTSLIAAFDRDAVRGGTGLAKVKRTMQLYSSQTKLGQKDELEENTGTEEKVYENVFVIGDSADSFGAIKAGHEARDQVSH